MIDNLTNRYLKHRVKIVESIAFIMIKIKTYYDVYHTLLLLRLNNKTYLRLYHKY